MQSKAKSVDDYLQEVPQERLEAMRRLRALCREFLHDHEEGMYYGMPSYRRGEEEPSVGFASQKNCISIYILRQEVLDKYRDQLTSANLGKGCIRYRNPEKIDFSVVRKMLLESAVSNGDIC